MKEFLCVILLISTLCIIFILSEVNNRYSNIQSNKVFILGNATYKCTKTNELKEELK